MRFLCRADADLHRVTRRYGTPSLWVRSPGFATLVRIILEQQVSLASARAVFGQLRRRLGRVSARRFLQLDNATLRACGFSRQKASYCRDLARAVHGGELRLAPLARLDDEAVRARLVRQRGIGDWTVDIYLMTALRRPDVWPAADLALIKALMELKGLRKPPDAPRLERLTRSWRPWRSVAATVCWHHYLSVRGGRG